MDTSQSASTLHGKAIQVAGVLTQLKGGQGNESELFENYLAIVSTLPPDVWPQTTTVNLSSPEEAIEKLKGGMIIRPAAGGAFAGYNPGP